MSDIFIESFSTRQENRLIKFQGNYIWPKRGARIANFETETNGGSFFFVGPAKKISIRFQITTGDSFGVNELRIVNVPDASFSLTLGNGSIENIDPGSSLGSCITNTVNAINASSLPFTASALRESVKILTDGKGQRMNRVRFRAPTNNNANGDGRFLFYPRFLNGTSHQSTNPVTFNVFGRTGGHEHIGGVSLFDTSSTVGRTGTNVVYSFDESIISCFESLEATWEGLAAGDECSIYFYR